MLNPRSRLCFSPQAGLLGAHLGPLPRAALGAAGWAPGARMLAACIVCAAATFAPCLAETDVAATPKVRVERAVGAVLEVLNDPRWTRAQRWQAISRIVEDNFDFRGMSRRVLGTQWRAATVEEREQFSEYFSQYLEETFRSKMERYSDHRVDYLGERIRGGRATVETVIRFGKVRTPVTYKLRRSKSAKGGQWRAYDVVIEGVSLVASYRNTFAAIAKSEGMDGLIADVQRRIAKQERKQAESRISKAANR